MLLNGCWRCYCRCCCCWFYRCWLFFFCCMYARFLLFNDTHRTKFIGFFFCFVSTNLTLEAFVVFLIFVCFVLYVDLRKHDLVLCFLFSVADFETYFISTQQLIDYYGGNNWMNSYGFCWVWHYVWSKNVDCIAHHYLCNKLNNFPCACTSCTWIDGLFKDGRQNDWTIWKIRKKIIQLKIQ